MIIATLLCCATLCFGGLAANPPTKAAATTAPVSQGNITILEQDSGTNLTKMNITFTVSPTYRLGAGCRVHSAKTRMETGKYLNMATDGWNVSSKELPNHCFSIEVRDENLMLLYHYVGIQLPYFTNSNGIRMATIDVPMMPMNGVFFICFYGYGYLPLAAELQNAIGNTYYYDARTAQLFSGVLPMRNNQTLPVNWLICYRKVALMRQFVFSELRMMGSPLLHLIHCILIDLCNKPFFEP